MECSPSITFLRCAGRGRQIFFIPQLFLSFFIKNFKNNIECLRFYYICNSNITKMSYKTVADVLTLLKNNGFSQVSQKGSHIKLSNGSRIVIVPNHGKKGIEKGTYYSILRQAGLK